MTRFELWLVDERGVLSKPRDKGDHTGWAKAGSIRGWARVERKVVTLFRTDAAESIPRNVRGYYESRFPDRRVDDRIDIHRRIAEAVYLNRAERGR